MLERQASLWVDPVGKLDKQRVGGRRGEEHVRVLAERRLDRQAILAKCKHRLITVQ